MISTVARENSADLPRQAFALRRMYPTSDVDLKPHLLRWRGVLRPTDLSMEYSVQLTHPRTSAPSVLVLEPDLVLDPNGRLPHVFEDGTLCLNRHGQWKPHMLHTVTTLAWTSEWLYYYELWRGTNLWLGDPEVSEEPHEQLQVLHAVQPQTHVDKRARDFSGKRAWP